MKKLFKKMTEAQAMVIVAIITTVIGGYFTIRAASRPIELSIQATQSAEIINRTAKSIDTPTVTNKPIITNTVTVTQNVSLLTKTIHIPPSRTSTITASFTQTPQSTLTSTLTPQTRVLFQETFLSNEYGWRLVTPIASTENSSERKIIGGEFIHRLDCVGENICIEFNKIPELLVENFALHIDAAIYRSSGSSLIGIIFRQINEKNYYYVYFQSDGEYFVGMRHNGSFETLKDWSYSDAFNTELGKVNRLSVIVEDFLYTILVNGDEICVVEDGNIAGKGSMSFGLAIQSQNYATVRFDNLLIEEMP